MDSAELLKRYDAIWRVTQQMLVAASAEEWDELIELVGIRAALTDSLMAQEDRELWGLEEQVKKNMLIHNMLATDEEIKILTKSWMAEIQERLGSIGTERKLQKAYDTP